ncbi:PREDICTED: uncharacterized protein LOC105557496 [Vollenhovia emeryi]|uniref:uncharacterized protein LOC105557496 n=1 Tax=Vollenhovia emeryi TaxID=411798 RepID=UPI0005F42F8E|nr:PREDICTED: uncharacterized protein LOC105557496 [Vollenhovia emeryi]
MRGVQGQRTAGCPQAGGGACPPASKSAMRKNRREERKQPVASARNSEPPGDREAGNPIDPDMGIDVEGQGSLDWDHTDTPAEMRGKIGEEAQTGKDQANLNHARQAQDLFLHTLAERGCGVGVIAEPYSIPNSPNWAGSADGSVAITWRRTGQRHVPWTKAKEGEGWVIVECGTLSIMGVYLRPSLSRAEVEERLDEMESELRGVLPGPILVAGDFNVKSADWGSRRPDAKGAVIAAWAARLGLRLENRGNASTCVRAQGESIVDLAWTSPKAARWMEGWRVVEEVETLGSPLH